MDVIVMLYDISSSKSLDFLETRKDEIDRFGGKEVRIILVGNKCDLASSRQVTEEQAQEWAKKHNIHKVMEVWCLDGTLMEECLHSVNLLAEEAKAATALKKETEN